MHVLIVGAGMAGLSCAVRLHEAGHEVTVLEAASTPGGRVRTERVDGFQLDRGFQVLLTAYPEAHRMLDYDALDLHRFQHGALVFAGGGFHTIADPLRSPLRAWRALAAPFVSVRDLLPLHRLHWGIVRRGPTDIWESEERTAVAELRAHGISEPLIDAFFRPFFGGVFFDRALGTSSRMLDLTYRTFAMGETTLPAGGMDRIPAQLAARLPDGTVRCATRVTSLDREARIVEIADGDIFGFDAIVLATSADEAARLLGQDVAAPAWRSTATLYYAADRPPIEDPVLLLDGEGTGPVNHLCVPSNVAPSYAPAGAALISANTVGIPDLPADRLEAAVRDQMGGWFGPQVRGWRLLSVIRIREALPDRSAPSVGGPGLSRTSVRHAPGVFLAGDHRADASLNGALESGRLAAEAVLKDAA